MSSNILTSSIYFQDQNMEMFLSINFLMNQI